MVQETEARNEVAGLFHMAYQGIAGKEHPHKIGLSEIVFASVGCKRLAVVYSKVFEAPEASLPFKITGEAHVPAGHVKHARRVSADREHLLPAGPSA